MKRRVGNIFFGKYTNKFIYLSVIILGTLSLDLSNTTQFILLAIAVLGYIIYLNLMKIKQLARNILGREHENKIDH